VPADAPGRHAHHPAVHVLASCKALHHRIAAHLVPIVAPASRAGNQERPQIPCNRRRNTGKDGAGGRADIGGSSGSSAGPQRLQRRAPFEYGLLQQVGATTGRPGCLSARAGSPSGFGCLSSRTAVTLPKPATSSIQSARTARAMIGGAAGLTGCVAALAALLLHACVSRYPSSAEKQCSKCCSRQTSCKQVIRAGELDKPWNLCWGSHPEHPAHFNNSTVEMQSAAQALW